MQWETVIGLEIHVQLTTQSKIFSGSSTAFGNAANSQANAVDMALPGTLPVVNKAAVEQAVKLGLGLNAKINKTSVFDRKNYFYPDSPKGYQTTQMDYPIVGAGVVDISLEDGSQKSIRIHHAHLEEDAGKSVHEGFIDASGIDLNRAGTPLIEIVTEPDMRSAEEAVTFAKKLHSIVTSLGVCDGEMSQGSMRFDVNVSVRMQGDEAFGTRTETKNLNSFKFMEDAIELEVERQIELLESGQEVVQETRLYNGDTGVSRSMRSKEEANDYRYFPCPDLLPVVITDEDIEAIRRELPELPEQRQQRFISEYQLSEYDAGLLSNNRFIADFFEQVISHCDDAKLAANWVNGELAAALNKHDISISNCPLNSEQLGQMITRIKDGTISSKQAKTVFEALWQQEGDVDAIIDSKGLKQVSDTGALEAMIDQVIADNPQQVEQYKAADDAKRKKMTGFFVGQIMKASKGQANPAMVNQLLMKKLNS